MRGHGQRQRFFSQRLTSDLNTRHLATAAYTLFGDVAEQPTVAPDNTVSVPFLERFTCVGFIRNRAEGKAVREQVVGGHVEVGDLGLRSGMKLDR